MKFFLHLILFSCFLLSQAASSHGFSKPVQARTQGTLYPHILKTETYTLNTRNIKVLTQEGRFLWLGTSLGAIRYDTTTAEDYQVLDNQNGLLSNGIFTIKSDPQGRPWIGTYGGGLSFFDKNNWINLNTPDGLNDAFVYDVEFDGEVTWIATWSGANRVRGALKGQSDWEAFTVENTQGGLIDNWVYGIELGKNGRVWFGTESGVSLYDGKKWRAWNHKDGLGAPYELVSRDNRGVVSPFSGGHHSGHGQDTKTEYRPNYVVSFLLDKKGRLWIGTWGGGLSMLDTEKLSFRNFTKKDGLPGNFILALKEGPHGDLWIGSNAGLSRFDGNTFENYAKINGLGGGFVFSIEFGPDHSLWLGGHNRLERLHLNPASGQPINLD